MVHNDVRETTLSEGRWLLIIRPVNLELLLPIPQMCRRFWRSVHRFQPADSPGLKLAALVTLRPIASHLKS